MRQISRPLCSHGAESASNSEMGVGVAPHIAQIAEMWIGGDGEPRIHKVWCALDCGVRPDQ
jgi:isoquinoline 1-oxidoreductase subunit beta